MQTAQLTDASELAERISSWLRNQLDASGAQRFVLGLSGGIDSAVVAGLAARAVGAGRVLGVMMPSASNQDDLDAARLVAKAFEIPTLAIDLSGSTAKLLEAMPTSTTIRDTAGLPGAVPAATEQLAHANIKPRLRMTTLYYIANICHGMVLGTGNRTETMIGYFTKHGDGGVDLKPISKLYKRDVREVARAIGVPQPIIDRPPSAGLWDGQTDEQEIGISYDELDATLTAIEQGETEHIGARTLERVEGMIRVSEHKRRPAPEVPDA
jgi:NAD+ synthase